MGVKKIRCSAPAHFGERADLPERRLEVVRPPSSHCSPITCWAWTERLPHRALIQSPPCGSVGKELPAPGKIGVRRFVLEPASGSPAISASACFASSPMGILGGGSFLEAPRSSGKCYKGRNDERLVQAYL